MPVCVPLNELQHTGDFLDLVNSEGQVCVTNNGHSAFWCIRDSQLGTPSASASEKLKKRMELAKSEVELKKYSPFEDVIQSLR